MTSLTPKAGQLGMRLAAHLLRRCSYHITPARIQDFSTKTADQAVDALFVVPPIVHSEGPINWEDGVTAWMTTGPYANKPSNANRSKRAVKFWLYNEMLHDTSIRHKLTFFLHSIFTGGDDTDWRLFEQWRLMQLYALDTWDEFAFKITLDNAMLRFLNNNLNKKGSPNENYAREFLELFTILKGPAIGTGNYTHYTEHDIQQTARVLTGFTTHNLSDKDPQTGIATGRAVYSNHDKGNKKFSAAFNHQTILGAISAADMYRELQDFVDMIFGQKETARAFSRRLYHFFVSDQLTTDVELGIIEPMATQLQLDGYHPENALKLLLKSEHFYDEDDSDASDEIIGGKIKSPLELFLSSANLFDANQLGVLNNTPTYYDAPSARVNDQVLAPMGLPLYPLTVEGYPGFFKGTGYSKNWFDQATIAHRYKLADSLLTGRAVTNNNSIPFQTDTVTYFVQHFSNLEYADQLLDQFLEIALPETPDTDRRAYFLDKLLGGLSPINWYFEWQGYLSTQDDSAVRIALDNLFEAVVKSPEFQTF